MCWCTQYDASPETMRSCHHVVARMSRRHDHERIAALVREEEAECVVVGMPHSLSGRDGPAAKAARTEASALASVVGVPVETYDERFTTRMAAQTRRSSGAGAAEDSIAAAHLLESFLMALASRAGLAEDD